MPRANRRRRDEAALDLDRVLAGMARQESHPDGDWFVRTVVGRQPGRQYRCPGCQQLVDGAVSHVVAWPAEGVGGVENRRHWHTVCWQARTRRPPKGSSR